MGRSQICELRPAPSVDLEAHEGGLARDLT